MSDPDAAWAALVTDAIGTLAPYPAQPELRDRYLDLLIVEGADALIKQRRQVHLTASLVVLDTAIAQVLLTHHTKARMWLQFGGHLEVCDGSLVAAALREGSEESGLAMPETATLVQLEAHLLGDGFAWCREHLDVRFAVSVPATAPTVSSESLDVAWWPTDALPEQRPEGLDTLIATAQAALRP